MTIPQALRLDRAWIHALRIAQRHIASGDCGCGRMRKSQPDHKVCPKCRAERRSIVDPIGPKAQ